MRCPPAVILATGISSIIAGAFNLKQYFNVPLTPHLTRDHQFWRLIVSPLVWQDSTALVLGVMLFYNTSMTVERAFGTLKFASFVAISLLTCAVIQLVALLLLQKLHFRAIPAGCYGLLFATVFQYHRIIPSTYAIRVFGVRFTSKTFNYFFALQLSTTNLPDSLVASISGVLAGILYRSELFNLASFRLPPLFTRLGSLLRPLIGSTRTHRRSTRTVYEPEADNDSPFGVSTSLRQGMTAFTSRSNNSGPVIDNNPPNRGALQQWRAAFGSINQATGDPQHITALQSMFPNSSRQSIETALQNSNNDVSRAAEQLLATT